MAQLPERLEKTFFVPMTREQLVHHRENEEIVARIAAKWRRSRHLSERDQRRLMIALQRMRMSCDSSYLLDEQSDHGTKAGEILTLLGEILEEGTEEPGTKVVIFSQWLRMHEILAKRIAAAGWGHVLFHGGIDSRARAKLVDRFRDDPECRIFLSTDAGGVGLNLQQASVVMNVDLPWNPAVLEQRIGRVHRLGQRAPVRVVNFVAEGTIEQGMLSVLRFKKSLFAGVLDGGETEVFLGKGRLDRFMESIERVTAEIPPVPIAAETPADVGPPESSVPEADAPMPAEPLLDPVARLLESGVGFLRQLEAALPPEDNPGDNGGRSTVRRIETRRDADGSTFLAVPMPSREAVARFTDGLAALLRSMLP
jgi:hypothetical protein